MANTMASTESAVSHHMTRSSKSKALSSCASTRWRSLCKSAWDSCNRAFKAGLTCSLSICTAAGRFSASISSTVLMKASAYCLREATRRASVASWVASIRSSDRDSTMPSNTRLRSSTTAYSRTRSARGACTNRTRALPAPSICCDRVCTRNKRCMSPVAKCRVSSVTMRSCQAPWLKTKSSIKTSPPKAHARRAAILRGRSHASQWAESVW